jgi:hypothetical protein
VGGPKKTLTHRRHRRIMRRLPIADNFLSKLLREASASRFDIEGVNFLVNGMTTIVEQSG